MKLRTKIILGGVGLLLLVAAAVPWLVPTSSWVGPVQSKASETLGTEVKLAELHASFFPTPHLTVTGIQAGEGAIKLGGLRIYPTLSSLFSDTPRIRAIRFNDLTLTKRGTDLLMALGSKAEKGDAAKKPSQTPSSAPPVYVDEIVVKNANLDFGNTKLEAVDAEITLNNNAPVTAVISLNGGRAKLNVKPDGDGWALKLEARDWVLPAGAPLRFTSLDASGRADRSKLSLPAIKGKLYGGDLNGDMELNYAKGARLGGRAQVSGVDLAPLQKDLKLKGALTGRLEASGPFSSAAAKMGGLGDAFTGDFAFNVRDGALQGFDLANAAKSLIKDGSKGGQTKFDQLTGNVRINGKAIRLSNVKVSSGVLNAQANVDISPARALNGRVDVDLKGTSGLINVPLAVSGTTSDPILLPTKGALAGAVAGSVLLPGVGTGVGASVGDRLGKMFGK